MCSYDFNSFKLSGKGSKVELGCLLHNLVAKELSQVAWSRRHSSVEVERHTSRGAECPYPQFRAPYCSAHHGHEQNEPAYDDENRKASTADPASWQGKLPSSLKVEASLVGEWVSKSVQEFISIFIFS